MKFELTFECELPHPVERVWWALTDRDALDGWFMQTDIAASLGARFTIRGAPEGAWRGWTACRILDMLPHQRIVWSFDAEDGFEPTTVTFNLTPKGRSTHLRLTHAGAASPEIAGQLGRGWPSFLARLSPFLAEHARSGHSPQRTRCGDGP